MTQIYLTRTLWNHQRPGTLVVACSDGRLQENLDDFLHRDLGITHYDRLYGPGGGGALAGSGFDYLRAESYRRECRFLLEAHTIRDLYLIFHGPAEDGPEEALCADYRRRFPGTSPAEIRRRQEQDVNQLRTVDWGVKVTLHAFRCEVRADKGVQFVVL